MPHCLVADGDTDLILEDSVGLNFTCQWVKLLETSFSSGFVCTKTIPCTSGQVRILQYFENSSNQRARLSPFPEARGILCFIFPSRRLRRERRDSWL